MNSDDSGDRLVRHFFVTSMILGVTLLIAFQAHAAEKTGADIRNTTIVNIEERDYNVLLSALFGRIDAAVDDDAFTFAREFDIYRMQIAQEVQYNAALLKAAHQVIGRFPEEARISYTEELIMLQELVATDWKSILPFVQNDTFLSDAIMHHYNLYEGWWRRLAGAAKHAQRHSWFQALQKNVDTTSEKIKALFTDVSKKVMVRA